MEFQQVWTELARKLALLWPFCWFIGFAFGWVILRPLRLASKDPQAATQFRLTDFVVLLAVLFAVGWLPMIYFERVTQERLLTALLFLHSLFIAWWWWGLRLVSRARVQASKARAVILGLSVPLACGGSLGFIAAPISVSEMISSGLQMTGDVQAQGNKVVEFLYWATKVVPVWALLGLAAFWGSRRLVYWAVKHRLDGEPEEDQPF